MSYNHIMNNSVRNLNNGMVSRDLIENFFNDFIKEKNLNIKLSFTLPSGYEKAFGTFDITKRTLFLNFEYIKNKPDYEIFYHLLHELRHAEQYIYAEQFDKKIKESINYVIMYDGNCYKLVNGDWKHCRLENNLDYELFYMNLPYELDANKFAYRQTLRMFKNNEIKNVYKKFFPVKKIKYKNLKCLFKLIDEKI